MLRIQRGLPDRYRDATDEELNSIIGRSKDALGDKLFILGHHYQRDDVIAWADARGDSYHLSVLAQQRPDADYIVFCGVHFMAESADVLTGDHQAVVLPDLNAGCSMADMADIDEVERAWSELATVTDVTNIVPITYMNSSAAIKAFVGRHGGAVCTSSNARSILEWALADQATGERSTAKKVLFFPDQHLGRNTGLDMGYGHHDMRLWDPRQLLGGLDAGDVNNATVLLWKGHCSIHQRFKPEHIHHARAEHPGLVVIAHPEARYEVCEIADEVGSTSYIIQAVEQKPAGSVIGIATEIHLVSRLAKEHPDKTIFCLDPVVCPCSTMSRIDLPHLAWVLENLVEGRILNQISVDSETSRWSKVSLKRMIDITTADRAAVSSAS